VPYGRLRELCARDPPSAWGAYVAGCLLALARERGVRPARGVSVLICSDVPEGAAGQGVDRQG
jgi:galactokinase